MRVQKKREFSKIILALVMVTYFFGVIIGGYVVLTSAEQLQYLLAYIGAQVAVAIGFYAWKAKGENIEKIRGSHDD
jgi:hypothetical protein